MNSIRSQIFGGEEPERRSLIGSKRPRGAKTDALQSIAITRAEQRTSDTRAADRHRLVNETVGLTHGGRTIDVVKKMLTRIAAASDAMKMRITRRRIL